MKKIVPQFSPCSVNQKALFAVQKFGSCDRNWFFGWCSLNATDCIEQCRTFRRGESSLKSFVSGPTMLLTRLHCAPCICFECCATCFKAFKLWGFELPESFAVFWMPRLMRKWLNEAYTPFDFRHASSWSCVIMTRFWQRLHIHAISFHFTISFHLSWFFWTLV